MKTIFHLHFSCYSSTLTRIVIGQFFIFRFFFLSLISLFCWFFFSSSSSFSLFCIMVIILSVFTKSKLINQNWLFELYKMIMHRVAFFSLSVSFYFLLGSIVCVHGRPDTKKLNEKEREREIVNSNQELSVFYAIYIG